jgi:predicted DNA-binding transcriptional regulator YafY
MTKFDKCLWIVDKLLQHEHLSLKEMNEKWERAVDYDYREISERTFNRYKQQIAESFGLDIVYSAVTRSYYLSNKEAVKNKALFQYLLGAFQVRALNTLAIRHKDKIMLQETPSGNELLGLALKAIDEKKTLVFAYRSYYAAENAHFEVIPCFLRMFEGRWYLVGEYLDRSATRVLALERMSDVKVGERTAECSSQLTPDAYYGDCFGIIRDNLKPVLIKLKAYEQQAQYIRSLPLHPSQEEIETAEHHAVFSYYLRPSFDFIQEILWHQDKVEVLEPQVFRNEIKSLIQRMLNLY